MIAMADDGGAMRRLIGADPLEHPSPVVQSVGEYVYLRVLPGDELSVVPDEVRLLHKYSLEVFEDCLGGFHSVRVAPQIPGAQAVGERPVDGRFYRRRLPFHSQSVA